MTSRRRAKLVLAIYFQTKGFGYVLLQHWLSPVDWGSPEVQGRDRETRCVKRIDALLSLHTPDVVVLQDTSKTGTRRAPRIRALNRRTLELAKRRDIPVRTYSREQVLDYFEELGATTKQSIAETIAKHIPALIRAAEMLMAEDAAAATKELLSMVDEIGQTIEDILSNLRKLGSPGV